jgi:hypothetical protein
VKPSRSLVRGVKDLFTLRVGSQQTSESASSVPRPHRWSLSRRPKTAPAGAAEFREEAAGSFIRTTNPSHAANFQVANACIR